MTTPHLDLHLQRLPHAVGLGLPRYGSDGAAGLDLEAAVEWPVDLWPGKRMMIPTGYALEIPPGYFGLLAARSSLAKWGVTLANGVGIIDSDYRGEVKVALRHFGEPDAPPYQINRGDRIAQILLLRADRFGVSEIASLSPTARDHGGFGSTGR